MSNMFKVTQVSTIHNIYYVRFQTEPLHQMCPKCPKFQQGPKCPICSSDPSVHSESTVIFPLQRGQKFPKMAKRDQNIRYVKNDQSIHNDYYIIFITLGSKPNLYTKCVQSVPNSKRDLIYKIQHSVSTELN